MTDNAAGTSPAKPGLHGLMRRAIVFPGGRRALAVVAPTDVLGADAAAALQLEPPRGLVVLVGSTTELPTGMASALRSSLGEGLAGVTADEHLTAVTGGTDAGIFALFGRGLAHRPTTPCVGVAPASAVTWPGRVADRGRPSHEKPVHLEPHHTHFLLVDSAEWGSETAALTGLTATLGAECPSVAILAGGGGRARGEVLEQIRGGREVVVLAGTGRLADELARATIGDRGTAVEPRTAEAAASGLVTVLDSGDAPTSLAQHVRERLGLTTPEAER